MAKLPAWSSFWAEYLDYVNYASSDVKTMIGGSVDAGWITNTCAIRMSYAMNYVGIPLPRAFPNMSVLKGGDGKRYAFRVREMRPWLRHELGAPDFEVKKKEGEAFDRSQLEGMYGLVAFDIRFGDATGHLDALYEKTFSSEQHGLDSDYFAKATKVSVWKAG